MKGSEGSDDPNHPGTSHSLAACASTLTGWRATGYQTPCIPSYSHSQSLSWDCHSQCPRPRSHTSDSSVLSFGSSSPTKSESDTGSSRGDSNGLEQYLSHSPDVIFLGKTKDDNGSGEEETSSILDILNSDTEEVCMATVHRKAHQSDAPYATW